MATPIRKREITPELAKCIVRRKKPKLSKQYIKGLKRRVRNIGQTLKETEWKDIVIVRRSYQYVVEPMSNYLLAETAVLNAMIERELHIIDNPDEYENAYLLGFDDLCKTIQ